jgi:hypothetical protein
MISNLNRYLVVGGPLQDGFVAHRERFEVGEETAVREQEYTPGIRVEPPLYWQRSIRLVRIASLLVAQVNTTQPQLQRPTTRSEFSRLR